MTEYVKWMPRNHGDYPPFWAKDMLASVDEDGEKVNADWAWLAWSTYYVPYEAVHGVPRPAPVDEGDLVTFKPFDERTYELMDIRRDIEAHLSGGSRAANMDEINQIWEMLERMLRLIEKERSDD
jgi:hypothetical protein